MPATLLFAVHDCSAAHVSTDNASGRNIHKITDRTERFHAVYWHDKHRHCEYTHANQSGCCHAPCARCLRRSCCSSAVFISLSLTMPSWSKSSSLNSLSTCSFFWATVLLLRYVSLQVCHKRIDCFT